MAEPTWSVPYCGTCGRSLGFAGMHECRLPGDPEGTCRHPLHGRASGVCPACRGRLERLGTESVPAETVERPNP